MSEVKRYWTDHLWEELHVCPESVKAVVLASDYALLEQQVAETELDAQSARLSASEWKHRAEQAEAKLAAMEQELNEAWGTAKVYKTQADQNRTFCDKAEMLYEQAEAALSTATARVAELERWLKACDYYARTVTELFLLPEDGVCISCHMEVPPSIHDPLCQLKPLMRDVRVDMEGYKSQQALAEPQGGE